MWSPRRASAPISAPRSSSTSSAASRDCVRRRSCIVATIRALKYHGGADLKQINAENLAALEKGIANLERHVNNVRNHYGLPCVVSVNQFTADTAAEHELLAKKMAALNVPLVIARSTGPRAEQERPTSPRRSWRSSRPGKSNFSFVYDEKQTLWDKIKTIATKIYGAADISADAKIRAQIEKLQKDGYGHYPVCIAKTQYSFSTDPGRARRAERPHRSTSARCVSRPARNSSWWSAAT